MTGATVALDPGASTRKKKRPEGRTVDTPAARARSAARLLNGRKGIHVEKRFRDAHGAEHEIRSCPVPGGRYLYDSSSPWGLRALGFCRGDESEHMAALGDDYAGMCEAQQEPVCRPLLVSDLRRPSGDAASGGGS